MSSVCTLRERLLRGPRLGCRFYVGGIGRPQILRCQPLGLRGPYGPRGPGFRVRSSIRSITSLAVHRCRATPAAIAGYRLTFTDPLGHQALFGASVIMAP